MRYPSTAHVKTCSKDCGTKLRRTEYEKISTKVCIVCGKPFIPKHNKSKGLYCSYKCRGLADRKELVFRNGYRYIHKPEHPNARGQGYFAEHRYIMEQHIGRLLDKKEVVHHINHVKNDNRLENLMLYGSAGQHTASEHPPKRENGRYAK